MKNKLFLFLPLLFLTLFTQTTQLQAQEQPKLVDQIVAHVNERIILKSEIDQRVADYLRQAQMSQQRSAQFSEELWYSFLESTIDNYVMLEKAQIDSITVTDDQVNAQMDQRIQQLISQAGSEQALEEAFGKSIIQLRADFREDFREQMITQQVQQQKLQSIKITRPEVEEFFNKIPADSLPTIPEQVSLSQIVIVPPAHKDADSAAFAFAQQLRDSILVHGKSIEELAQRHSEDPGSRRNGGLLPLMSLNELVPEYSAAAAALQPGGISKVVETQFGYHVIKLKRRVGDQIETNHILITVDEEELDEEYAINRLNEIRDSLLTNPELKFSDMARKYSEDDNTADLGGKIFDPQTGERLIPLNRLDPAMYRIVLLMDEEGAISEPKSFTLQTRNRKAYRIVRLDRQIPEHIANLKQDYERIKQIALQQKQMRVIDKWMSELREDVYVNYRIPVPESADADLPGQNSQIES
ncbi:peptidylprolyl isomerase [Gracilimonas mengyeensis]|uniref:Periplasmic chaperone for outer membrane proteins SurA n=1 Tax=Gracilimonas mengyeensis TaxID=1302730 RepID=A0A521AK19_9BACT|nr:peptidylprolyl isomerase [Gracilimonas mengyeensis]SMO35118.1 periplasmic chaperone for outer membrane proteins SurA [Gracilimonas mengyeensis]